MVNGKVTALENTDIAFTPRYDIELAKAGEFGDRTTFGSRTSVTVRRPSTRAGSRSTTPRYQVKCGYCNRVFPRAPPPPPWSHITTPSAILATDARGGNAPF